MPDLLDAVGVSAGARALRLLLVRRDVHRKPRRLDQARRRDVLVALRMLDRPVTADHGGPVRLYAAPMYGYKSLKWLGGIELTDTVVPGYWEVRGYDVDAWVGHSNGRDDAPV